MNLTPLDNAIMWQSIATGEADAMVSGWLPNSHGPQFEEYGDQMEHLGASLEGAFNGLVVPAYMEDVNSIADLDDHAGKVITGIEPGAGIMAATQRVMETYPNLADWDLMASSTGAMNTALDQAYNAGEEIVITGWSPHWIFQAYDLKYLEDPELAYGEEETLNTFVRLGFKEDHPRAYQILGNFHWDIDQMESVMVAISEGLTPEHAARDFVDENPDLINSWLADN